MADLSNFWFLHLAAFNYCFAGDPHPTHFCPIWCGATPRRNAAPRRDHRRTPFAEWTDLGPKGTMCYVPAAFIVPNGRLWFQNWNPGQYVNNSYTLQGGVAGMGIEYLHPWAVCAARGRVRNELKCENYSNRYTTGRTATSTSCGSSRSRPPGTRTRPCCRT